MIPATNLRTGTGFDDNGQIYLVISYEHTNMGRGSATIRVKVRNLRTGAITEKSFISGSRVAEINLDKRKVQYLYSDENDCYFMDSQTFEQFNLNKGKIGAQVKFLKDGMEVTLLTFEGEPLSLDLPVKMDLKVADTDPGFRGDSVSNIYKDAVLENGLKVKVPLFIKTGEMVRIDTRTGEYVERVK